MRLAHHLVGLGCLALLVAAGCESEHQHLRPPKPPEEYKALPDNDPRVSGPIQYPADTMDQDPLLKRAKDASKSTPGPMQSPRMGGPAGGGGRMGGM